MSLDSCLNFGDNSNFIPSATVHLHTRCRYIYRLKILFYAL